MATAKSGPSQIWNLVQPLPFSIHIRQSPALHPRATSLAEAAARHLSGPELAHMASKAAFTAEEWNQVLGGVFMAGFAVTAADPSGLWGLLKETFASGRALIEAKRNANASELSKAIVSDMETSEGRSAAQDYVKARLQGAKREEIKQRAIDALRAVAAIVDQNAASDAAAYKAWLLQIANNVAEASKEGGFLGFGGVDVSDAEKATLTEIAAALGTRA